ncbi:DUF3077 domain-containing protein [Pseudomonas sp. NPDC096917]|uniref:DUF3077 domain-containing protein n=1 Tax=Pseudomonas sp. NPDC096917 TaxID=3364483 RepID=UPI00383BE794
MNKLVPDPPLDAFHTSAHHCTRLYTINPGIPARDALMQVSLLLKGAELNADDISAHLSGLEAEQLWRVIHSMEMARGLVDSLLAD